MSEIEFPGWFMQLVIVGMLAFFGWVVRRWLVNIDDNLKELTDDMHELKMDYGQRLTRVETQVSDIREVAKNAKH